MLSGQRDSELLLGLAAGPGTWRLELSRSGMTRDSPAPGLRSGWAPQGLAQVIPGPAFLLQVLRQRSPNTVGTSGHFGAPASWQCCGSVGMARTGRDLKAPASECTCADEPSTSPVAGAGPIQPWHFLRVRQHICACQWPGQGAGTNYGGRHNDGGRPGHNGRRGQAQ